jgi:hypothetical protein
MKIDSSTFLPKARSEGIISKEVDAEVLVYDAVRDRAHCLNETAAAIWKLCDGQTTASEIEQRITGDRRPRTGEAEGSRQQAASIRQRAGSRGVARLLGRASRSVGSGRWAVSSALTNRSFGSRWTNYGARVFWKRQKMRRAKRFGRRRFLSSQICHDAKPSGASAWAPRLRCRLLSP